MGTKPLWWQSSGGEGVSLRIKSVLLAILPILVYFTGIGESELTNIILALVEAIAIALYIYGFARKNIFQKYHLGSYAVKRNKPSWD